MSPDLLYMSRAFPGAAGSEHQMFLTHTRPGLLVRCLLCVKLDLLCYLSERDVTVRFRKHFFSEAAAPRFI